ncbi:MAG: YjbR protein [Labilithrix sp.]|nr:YjbR protein [Labilithrix sp.]
MERAAFRTKRKIFATLGADRRVNLVIQPAEQREALLAELPDTFFSLGGWTRLGYLAVDLATVDETLLRELLTEAWRDALPVAKPPRKKR